MKRSPLDQNGFIPMLLTILAVVVLIIYFAYTRVLHAAH
jgi:F0F1-type ATP synthase membrane subunit b/b'